MHWGLFWPSAGDPLATVLFLQRNPLMRLYPIRIPEGHLRFPGVWVFWPSCLVMAIAAIQAQSLEGQPDRAQFWLAAFMALWMLRCLFGLRMFLQCRPLVNGAVTLAGIIFGMAALQGVHWAASILVVLLIAAKLLEKEALVKAAVTVCPKGSSPQNCIALGEVSAPAHAVCRQPARAVFSWPALLFREAGAAAFAILLVLLVGVFF